MAWAKPKPTRPYAPCGALLNGKQGYIERRRCRRPGSGAGGRCYRHGGRNPSGTSLKHLRCAELYGRPAVLRRQALFKLWGIPWYGGRGKKPTSQDGLALMSNALKTIEPTIAELVPADVNKPDEEKTANELMNEGLHAGLILGRDVVKKCHLQLTQLDAAGVILMGEDLKVLRLGTETAAWLVRASVRVAEGEFRSRRDDVLGKLLEQIAATKAAPQK